MRAFLGAAGLAVALACGAAPALAQMSSYEREKIEQALHAKAVEKNPAIFDGTAFNPDAGLDEAYKYMNAYVKGMNKAVSAINGMSGPARGSEEGQALIAEAQDKLAYSKAMTNAFRAFEAAKKAAPAAAPAAATAESAPAAAPQPEDGLTDAQRASMKVHLDTLDTLMASGVYDGKAFAPSVTLDEAQAFRSDFVKAVNGAIRAYNALPGEARSAPGADAMIRIAQQRQNDARRLKGAISNVLLATQKKDAEEAEARKAAEKVEAAAREAEAAARAAEEEARAAEKAAAEAAARQAAIDAVAPSCAAFAKDAMTRRNTRRIETFFAHPDGDISREDMARILTTTQSVAEECAKPDYAAMLETGCSDTPIDDPKAWCDAAVNAKATIRAWLVKPDPRWESHAEHLYQNADEVADKNGWIEVEGPTSLERTLSFDRMMYHNLADFGFDDQRALFAELGITAEDYDHYDGTMEMIDELREAIEDGAGRWPPAAHATPAEDATYSLELAGRLIADHWHKGENAEIIDAWLGRTDWKIHKNELGVIQRRTLPGYVLLKLPEDPFCQLRSFTLTEQYTGSGTFQPANGLRFGYVRFQECDRR